MSQTYQLHTICTQLAKASVALLSFIHSPPLSLSSPVPPVITSLCTASSGGPLCEQSGGGQRHTDVCLHNKQGAGTRALQVCQVLCRDWRGYPCAITEWLWFLHGHALFPLEAFKKETSNTWKFGPLGETQRTCQASSVSLKRHFQCCSDHT